MYTTIKTKEMLDFMKVTKKNQSLSKILILIQIEYEIRLNCTGT